MNQAAWPAGYRMYDADLCWLDCPRPGLVLVAGEQEICLCHVHAWVLEEGRLDGSYSGAPLPADSTAPEWPWRQVQARLVSAIS